MNDDPVNPLRRRMIRGHQDPWLRGEDAVRLRPPRQGLRSFFGRSPHRAGPEDLRRYHLHLAARGVGSPSINSAVSALRFFSKVTLGCPEVTEPMPSIREPQRLPVVLSADEVAALHVPAKHRRRRRPQPVGDQRRRKGRPPRSASSSLRCRTPY
ncbi:MAG TPA: hypothetical protein VES39_05225 [Rhodospirillales bacterium]|nr:hypothetical protein [Rhodospirillales bacterium]